MEQIQILLLIFGINSTLWEYEGKKTYKFGDRERTIDVINFGLIISGESYRIFKQNIMNENTTKPVKNASKIYHIEDKIMLPAINIEKENYTGNVYNLEVEEDESYLVPVVAHNCFGTVVNRFILQNFLGLPLTVFGDGEHQRGFLSITDSIQCLFLALENEIDKGEYRTWNQLAEPHTMNEIAKTVTKVGKEFGYRELIEHIDTPRAENTKHFEYDVVTKKLKGLGFVPVRTIEDEVRYLFGVLEPIRNKIDSLRKNLIPEIKWQ